MAFVMKCVHVKSEQTSIIILLALLAFMLSNSCQKVYAAPIQTYGEWSVFKVSDDTGMVCYLGSEPQKAEGNYNQRGDTYVLVTHRPGINTFDVVSVRAGYKYEKTSQVIIEIGSSKSILFTHDGHAWAESADIDSFLVNVMKKGIKMIVKGTSSRGTLTTDTYSLNGFTAAYKLSRELCN